MKKWKEALKWTGIIAGASIAYYALDRVAIKKAPLWPLSLSQAREKQANDALLVMKKKLNGYMNEGKIWGYGVVMEEKYGKKPVIKVSAENITDELKSLIPDSYGNVKIVLEQGAMPVAQV